MNIEYILFSKSPICYEFVKQIIKSVDNDFIPPISYRTDILNYANKISENANVVVAFINKKPIGIVATYLNSKPEFSYLTFVGVLPCYRNLKIGKFLLLKSIENCKKNNSAGIRLEMNSNNNKLLLFYRSLGFVFENEFECPFSSIKKYVLCLKFQ